MCSLHYEDGAPTEKHQRIRTLFQQVYPSRKAPVARDIQVEPVEEAFVVQPASPVSPLVVIESTEREREKSDMEDWTPPLRLTDIKQRGGLLYPSKCVYRVVLQSGVLSLTVVLCANARNRLLDTVSDPRGSTRCQCSLSLPKQFFQRG